MHRNALILFGVVLLVMATAALAQEPVKEQVKDTNITGVWEMVTQTPNGDMPGEVTFTQEKETLKVSMTGPQGMPMSGEGTVKEGLAQWSITISGPDGNSFTLTFKGKIDGEKITGETQVVDFFTNTSTATEKKK